MPSQKAHVPTKHCRLSMLSLTHSACRENPGFSMKSHFLSCRTLPASRGIPTTTTTAMWKEEEGRRKAQGKGSPSLESPD